MNMENHIEKRSGFFRVLALFLVLAFAVTCIPSAALASGGLPLSDGAYFFSNGLWYMISDMAAGTASVFGGSPDTGSTVVIPATVTTNGQTFKVVGIGKQAFSTNTTIKTLDLSRASNLKTIGPYAFMDCTSLTGSLIIPDQVTTIGESAFASAGFNGTLRLPPSLTRIERATFSNTRFTGALNIPASVTYIGYMAFAESKGFSQINLPAGLTHIDDFAFRWCSGLSGSLRLPASLTYLGVYAFSECSRITSLTIQGVKKIGVDAFSECTRLQSVTFSNSVEEIGDLAFYRCSGLRGTLRLPAQLRSIGDSAFYGCSRITGNLTIPKRVKRVGKHAFDSVNGITSVTIADSVKEIGDRAFFECRSLKKATIPPSVLSIGIAAFHAGPITPARPQGRPSFYVKKDSYAYRHVKKYYPLHPVYETKQFRRVPTSISLSPSATTMEPGDTLKMKLIVSPRGAHTAATWKSSKKSIATVDENGNVTAVQSGKVTITATSTSKKTAKCTIYVGGIPVSRVRLSTTRLNLKVGEKKFVRARVVPSNASHKAVTWRSTNPKAVSVNKKGVMQALKKGRTAIIATSVDGRKTAKCIVTVR